jgi:hypothetical protein
MRFEITKGVPTPDELAAIEACLRFAAAAPTPSTADYLWR